MFTLSLTMFRLRTQRAWSMLTVPVREPVGNWQEVTVGNTWQTGDTMFFLRGKTLSHISKLAEPCSRAITGLLQCSKDFLFNAIIVWWV